MDMSPQEYQAYVKQKSKKSPIFKDVAMAFLVGGLICVLGQLIQNGWSAAGLGKEDAGTATSCSLVLLSALLLDELRELNVPRCLLAVVLVCLGVWIVNRPEKQN